jgi:hypothetical protein
MLNNDTRALSDAGSSGHKRVLFEHLTDEQKVRLADGVKKFEEREATLKQAEANAAALYIEHGRFLIDWEGQLDGDERKALHKKIGKSAKECSRYVDAARCQDLIRENAKARHIAVANIPTVRLSLDLMGKLVRTIDAGKRKRFFDRFFENKKPEPTSGELEDVFEGVTDDPAADAEANRILRTFYPEVLFECGLNEPATAGLE